MADITPTILERLADARRVRLEARVLGALGGRVATEAEVREIIADVALSYVGVAEIGKTNTGHLVNRWLKATGLSGGYYWCMAYAQYPYAIAGQTLYGRDLLPFNSAGTKAVMDWAIKRQLQVPYEDIGVGDLIIYQSGSGPEGHARIVVFRDGETFVMAEGNAGGGDPRNGGMVVAKVYTIKASEFGKPVAKGLWPRGAVGVARLMDYAPAA